MRGLKQTFSFIEDQQTFPSSSHEEEGRGYYRGMEARSGGGFRQIGGGFGGFGGGSGGGGGGSGFGYGN